jgi:RNA polymerase sigma-70 factor (ECF subfamily)
MKSVCWFVAPLTATGLPSISSSFTFVRSCAAWLPSAWIQDCEHALDPSDVVQIVLAHAMANISSFTRPAEEFFAWLRQLAWDELSRLHRDHISTRKRSVAREEQKWTVRAMDESMVRLADQLAAKQLGPGSQLIHQELRARVRAAFQQLNAQDREVLVLRFLEQLSISDTAAALGVSEAAIKSRQFRAIDRLGKMLGNAEGEP